MKILHIVLSKGFAGSERSTSESCNAQCQEHEVTLAVKRSHRNRDGASIVDHIDKRVRIVELPNRFLTQWKLSKLIRACEPEVIHCHLRRSTRMVARIKPKAATVATLHLSFNGPHYGAMSGLICNARWQLDNIPPSYTGRVFKANNSLVPHRKLSSDEILAMRSSLGVSPETFLIGGVGRLSKSKGWDTLIEAFKLLPPSLPARLVIFGNGSQRSSLERLAASDARISLPGFRKDVKDIYQALDVFVCPSRFEPLPRVILEAMDAGTPVIASSADGCRELVEDYGGDSFPIGDAAALAAILARRAGEPKVRTNIDLRAHHIQNAAAATVAFYKELLK